MMAMMMMMAKKTRAALTTKARRSLRLRGLRLASAGVKAARLTSGRSNGAARERDGLSWLTRIQGSARGLSGRANECERRQGE